MDRIARRGIVVALLMAIGASAIADDAAPPAPITFATSLKVAREQATPPRPVVVTFSAPWCGWCRKMSSSTFPDPIVTALADKYLWVKLDPEEEPNLAARFQVHGLPHTVVLNENDELIGSQAGYMTPTALVKFLEDSLTNPQTLEGLPRDLLESLQQLNRAAAPAKVVREAVERLSKHDAAGRDELHAAFAKAGPTAFPYLANLLNDERLAVRAASGGTLQKLTRAELPFDPFAAADVRSQQVARWTEWLTSRHPREMTLPKEPEAPSISPLPPQADPPIQPDGDKASPNTESEEAAPR